MSALHRNPPQSKYWMFTYNNPIREHCSGLPDIDPDKIGFIVCQLEAGEETGTPHLQGYIELPARQRMSGVKSILADLGVPNHVHLEARRGNQAQAIEYCTKDETREDGPWEQGTQTEQRQGKRNDLLALRDAVKEKRGFVDIADDDSICPSLLKYHKAAELLRNAYQLAEVKDDEFRLIDVIVLHGPTGSGKTREAVADGAYKWNPSSPEWWDGYQGEPTILIDEFNGQVKITRMLQLLDGYKLRLPIKCSFSYARWTKVYITSNKSPDNWYKIKDPSAPFETGGVDPKHVEALKRRITTIKEMS